MSLSNRELAADLELRWLRGMALLGQFDRPNRVRQRLRDRLLSGPVEHHKVDIESLALLGPDLNEAAERCLRELAATRPGYLAPAVEPISVATSMSTHRPSLLFELAEAYYIERPVNIPGRPWARSPSDDGVRHHEYHGFGARGVAWYYGPFFALLRADFPGAIELINRLLDHAVRRRIDIFDDLST